MTDNKEKEEESGPFLIQHSPEFKETDYSYSVKKPPQVNVKSGNTLDHLLNNLEGLKYYGDTLLEKPAMGYNFYFKNGKCGKDSVPECRDKERYIYIRNIPDGNIPCSGGLNSRLYGFIPGIFQDIMDVNPLNIGLGMSGHGVLSDKCVKTPRLVGSPDKYKMIAKCSPPEHKIPCLTEFFESTTDNDSHSVNHIVNHNDDNHNIGKNKDNHNHNSTDFNNICLIIIVIFLFLVLIKQMTK